MRFLKSEAGAILLWLAVSLLAAALLTPVFYGAGKSLAAEAVVKDYPAVIESIASSAGRAKPGRFFSRALLVSALAFFPLLVMRVKRADAREGAIHYPLRKHTWPQRIFLLSGGILTGSACLGLLAFILHLTDAALPGGGVVSAGKIFTKALIPALGAGVIEELIFRGLLLGLWMRAASLWPAILGSSLLFSFVHFLKPPPGMEISDPLAWHSGFEILASTLGHFSSPAFFVTEFATLAFLGVILAWCRVRTFSLWLPIGLHAGLVFALKCFSMTSSLDPTSPLHPWFIGADLKSGILPLAALGLCFLLCVLLVRLRIGKSSEIIPQQPL